MTDAPGVYDLKPDFLLFLCHRGVYSCRESRDEHTATKQGEDDRGVVLRFGVLATWSLRESVFVLETNPPINAEAVCKIILYLTNMCRENNAISYGLLYDVLGFQLLVIRLPCWIAK